MAVTDVFVIGGGPAGLAAAIAARRCGLSVVVADGARPPIDKPCGEGLMPDALAALRRLGVSLDTIPGYRFRGIRFLDSANEVAADFSASSGLGLRRPILHEKLIHEAQRAGATLLWRTPVAGLTADGVAVAGKTVTARWIIGADGMRSRARRWCGLEFDSESRPRYAFRAHYRVRPWTDCMELHWGRDAQAYVTPVSAQEVCIVLASRYAGIRHAAIAAEFPKLAERLGVAELQSGRGEITVTRSLSRVHRGRVALIGDASGTVDAITGEGLCLSFRQAAALADAFESGDLRLYEAAHHRIARRASWMGRVLLLLDRHAHLRRVALRTLAAHPQVFARLVSIHTGGTSPQLDVEDSVFGFLRDDVNVHRRRLAQETVHCR